MARGLGRVSLSFGLTALLLAAGSTGFAVAQDAPPAAAQEKPDFRPWAEVSKGFTEVESADGGKSLYKLWKKDKDHSLIAELPRGWEGQRHFIALTVASGETYAGLQFGEMYVYWKRVNDRLLLIEPNVETRSTGDQESKSSVQNLFTDRVILDIPILTMGPAGQPVIDLRDLFVNRAASFYGARMNGSNTRVATLKVCKSFEENNEISFEMPNREGRLQEFHYSISIIKDNPSYKPRSADARVGYFTTVYRDLGKFTDKEKWVRYINRWHLEKRDPKLAMSPPKEPIVFYLDARIPVRYRQAVREGVLGWNKAFEQVGIQNAIEVYQQDEVTGAHMDKDPENVKYNFIRWLSNDIGTAIGPSRVHPLTGQILDADVVLTDGWIRYFWAQFNEIMPEIVMDGMSPETLAWLETRPQWDPRVRLADPGKRPMILAERARRGIQAWGGHPMAVAKHEQSDLLGQDGGIVIDRMMGDQEFDGLVNRTSQVNGLCMAARGKAFDMAMLRLATEVLTNDAAFDEAAGLAQDGDNDGGDKAEDKADDKKDEKKDAKKKKPAPELDGIPAWFVEPLLRDLVLHEVGHTLGLRHNFKASTQYTIAEINSAQVKGQKPFAASVMDYIGPNMVVENGKLVGDVSMKDIGVYDMWAIEYGYTTGDTKDVLKRVGEPGLDYATDEDTTGPDPRARRYDFGKDPLVWSQQRMELARYHRSRLLDKFIKDGESWSKVRRGYTITLGMQMTGVTTMANWVGGVLVNRDLKGDPGNRKPLTVVPAADQREALKFTIENSFFDESYGLTPELLEYMSSDKWLDAGGFSEAMQENAFPIHDRIGGMQASVMTMLLNPTTVRRVFDNEFRIASGDDAFTLPELFDTIGNETWKELDKGPSGASVRKPYVSSLRRNLQREYIDRMIDLSLPGGSFGEVAKPVSNLATKELRQLVDKITGIIGKDGKDSSGLDPYSYAHLSEAKIRIEKALDAQYIYNADQIGGGGFGDIFFGRPTP
ncbi:MAG: zinc-dependent metalloprotease [Phycisphaerae bacterium]